LLAGLGEALSRQGFSEEALQTWREAIEIFHELGDGDRTADLYARSSKTLWHMGDQIGCWDLCQEALALLENAPDSPGMARLLAEAGRIAHFGNMVDEMRPLCLQALAMAERLNLIEVQQDVRITLAYRSDDRDERLRILEEIAAHAEENGLLNIAARAHGGLAVFLDDKGDLINIHQHILRSLEISRQLGDVVGVLFQLGNLENSSRELGRLQDVEEILAEVENIQTIAPESPAQYYRDRIRAQLLNSRGEWDRAIEIFRILQKEVQQKEHIQRLAWRNLDLADAILELNRFGTLGDYEEAESALEENVQIGLLVRDSVSRILILCARQRRFSDVRVWQIKLDEDLKESSGNGVEMLKMWVEVELACADRRWGEAIAACHALIEICQRTGHRWEWARRLIDLGDALIQRNEPGDHEQARQHLQQSLEMFTEMGADGYVNVIQERLQVLNSSEIKI
jgi:tetratricopeptide (TPR) repeat protein